MRDNTSAEGAKTGRLAKWKLTLGVAFFFLFCIEAVFLVRVEKTQMLALQARKTGARLIDFAKARAQLNARSAHESANQYRARLSAQNAETQSLYEGEFSRQIAQLRDAFRRRGVTDLEFDEFYLKPIYPIGIREVGQRLYVMADRADPSLP